MKEQKIKYDKLKNTFDSAPTVFVDKKLNVIEVKENRTEKVETTNNRIQCILEEKQVLEESRALFSEISYLKKKVNDFQQSNDRLRAEVYMLKSQLAAQEEQKVKLREELEKRESQPK